MLIYITVKQNAKNYYIVSLGRSITWTTKSFETPPGIDAIAHLCSTVCQQCQKKKQFKVFVLRSSNLKQKIYCKWCKFLSKGCHIVMYCTLYNALHCRGSGPIVYCALYNVQCTVHSRTQKQKLTIIALWQQTVSSS